MMKWYPQLYIGEKLTDDIETLKDRIQSKDVLHPFYLITLAFNKKDLLDIRNSRALLREHLEDDLPMIVGVASDEKEAIDVVKIIIDECLTKTGSLDIHRFFM